MSKRERGTAADLLLGQSWVLLILTVERRSDEDPIAFITDTEGKVVDSGAAAGRQHDILDLDGFLGVEIPIEDVVCEMTSQLLRPGGTLAIAKELEDKAGREEVFVIMRMSLD